MNIILTLICNLLVGGGSAQESEASHIASNSLIAARYVGEYSTSV